ncbi:hypothetical protein EHM69_07045 [candidate division KSB1 bacterium]|nr:MAG: hypothetical protein EHM69_07045 [candidate division KSB1 bacterium]
MKSLVTSIVFFQLIIVSFVCAAVPQRFQYQGSLSRPNGIPLDTTINLTLRLYDTSSGGTLLWHETYSDVTVRRGLFSVTMGATTPLLQSYFQSGETYLGIVIGDDPEMAPRTRLVTLP